MMVSLSVLRPLISLILLLGLIGLIWIGAIRPAADWRAGRHDAHVSAIEEVERLNQSVTRLQNELTQLSQQEALDLIWTAQEMGEVTARVQSAISATARSSGVALRSVTPGKASDLPLAETVGFRLEGEARLDQFLNFARQIESTSPALIIETANLRRLSRAGDTSELPLVFVQLGLVAPIRLNGERAQ